LGTISFVQPSNHAILTHWAQPTRFIERSFTNCIFLGAQKHCSSVKGVSPMRLLIVTAVSLSMMISAAFAQSNSSSATPSERAAEGQQLAEGQQRETPAPLQSSNSTERGAAASRVV
jgi:hypothetical protein